jgi:Ca-activated chloride channel homolog
MSSRCFPRIPDRLYRTSGRQPRTASRQHIVNWLGLLILLSLGILCQPGMAATAPRTEELHSGSLLLKSTADSTPVEALRMASSFQVQVTGSVARVTVSQQFSNPSADWVEGLYVFPLAADAAVDELIMHVGERVIRADIHTKTKAHAIYEQARTEGRRASLVDAERPNMFTTSVANIAPRSSVTIEIAYLETIPYRDGRYTLQLPLAITPRYSPGAGTDPASPIAAGLTRAINGALGTTLTPERVTSPQQQVTIDVLLQTGFALQSVDSLHHQVSIQQTGDSRRVSLSGKDLPADRDFELVWVPAVQPDTAAAAFVEPNGADSFALLMLTPPPVEGSSSEVPREVEFIIDTSGSMSGPSIEQARAALQLGIDRLGAHDRFNVIRFSSDASSLFQSPQPLNETSRALASRFIAGLHADGGTEMRAPLEIALATSPPAGWLRQVVFITDGGVSNEAEIVRLIHEGIGNGRLFTVGIGAAPNAWFLQEAAAAGRGSYTFIAEREQVQARMADLFRKLEHPALVDLALHWPAGITVEPAAEVPGDLFSGDPLSVLVHLSGPLPAGTLLTLTGSQNGAAWVHQVPLTVVGQQSGVAKLWARERIRSITRQRNLGADAAQTEAAITAVALRHHLVSDFTSLVAVDVTPVRPAGASDRTEQAPVSAPTGSYWASTGFARTATSAPLLLLVALLWLGLAVLLFAAAPARSSGVPDSR